MTDEVDRACDAAKKIRDLEPICISHGDLRGLLQRLFIAEQGMKIEQARIHAETAIAAFKAAGLK